MITPPVKLRWPRLAVGLPLWLNSSGVGRNACSPLLTNEERASVLRRCTCTWPSSSRSMATVTTLTIVLADGLGRLLGVSGTGGKSGDIREALGLCSSAQGGAGLGPYHATGPAPRPRPCRRAGSHGLGWAAVRYLGGRRRPLACPSWWGSRRPIFSSSANPGRAAVLSAQCRRRSTYFTALIIAGCRFGSCPGRQLSSGRGSRPGRRRGIAAPVIRQGVYLYFLPPGRYPDRGWAVGSTSSIALISLALGGCEARRATWLADLGQATP